MAPAAEPPGMSAYAGVSSQNPQRQSSRISSRTTRSRTSSIGTGMQIPPSQIARSHAPAAPPAVPSLSASGRPDTSSSSTAGSHGHGSQVHPSTAISTREGLGGPTDRLHGRPSPSPTKRSVSGSDAPRVNASSNASASSSAIRRIPSFSLHKAADTDGSSYHPDLERAVSQPPTLLPSSASRSGIPRLGDTLLRKTSPSGHRVVSDNAFERSPGTSAARKSSYLDNQSTSTGLMAVSRLRPSPSESSLNAGLSSPSPSPSTMGPPTARPPSTSRASGMERDAREGTSQDSVHQSLFHSANAVLRGGRGPSGIVANASDKAVISRGSSAASQRNNGPSLPGLDPSLHLPLFDRDSNKSRQSNEFLGPSSLRDLHPDAISSEDVRRGVSRPVKTPEAKRRPDILGKLSARKPDLHIVLDKPPHQTQNQQPGSRFSAFSSAHNTPADEAGGLPARQASFRSRTTTGGTSPILSGGTSAAATPSNELSQSLSGQALGGATPGDAQAASSISSSPVTQRNRPTPAYSSSGTGLTSIPQTPERRNGPSPRPTPSAYDRAGQIGIGELATPRWNFPSSATSEWSSRATPATKAGYAATGRLPSESPTLASRTAMIPPLSVGRAPAVPISPALGRQREAEAQRHSRAISLSANNRLNVAPRSPSGPASAIRASPSVPADQFEGLSTISSLKRDFGQDPKEYIRALHEMSGGEPNSPPYSISAVSESDSGIDEPIAVASIATEKEDSRDTFLDSGSERLRPDAHAGASQPGSTPSPRLADLAWSGEETGPFVVSATGIGIDQPAAAESSTGNRTAGRSPTIDPYGISDAEYRGSFNLNSAIADLLRDDEERRQRLRGMGLESDAEASPRVSSDSKTATFGHSRGVLDSKVEPSTSSPLRSVHDVGAAEGIGARSRHVSSPGQIVGSPSLAAATGRNPRLASNSSGLPQQQQRASRSSKRMSSVSIGHSLLRGSMPFGAAEGLDSTEAAEQLRRLDGMGARKRSSSRERPPHDAGVATRSPRTSKVGSRPSSAGKGASTSQSRPSSPFASLQKGQRVEATSAVRGPSAAGERQRSMDEARTRRTSKTMGKPRLEDLNVTSSSPKASFDSPQAGAYMSPKIKKTTLPPLPAHPPLSTAIGTSTVVSSPGTPATSKRTSTVSVASRESLSKESITPSTTASRLSTSSKNKRASDTSSHFSPSEVVATTETGDGEDGRGSSAAVLRTGVSIPPVPPLPKAWDTSRGPSGDSFSSSADSSALQLLSAASNTENLVTPAAAGTPITSALPKNASLAAEERNQMGEKRELLPGRDDQLRLQEISIDSPVLRDVRRSVDADQAATSSCQTNQTHQQSQMSATSSLNNDASTRTHRDSQGGGMLKVSPMPAEDISPNSSKVWSSKSSAATPPSPVSVRRTPSFFRRRSDATALMAKDATEVPTSPSGGASFDSPKSQAVPSGRSSRKSILGLGNLLRNNTARKSMQHSVKAEEHSVDTDITNTSIESSEKGSAHAQTPTKTRILRRGSLIGRKRGKTLPSSTEPPVIPSTQLPPMQVAPLPASPTLASPSMDEQDTFPSQPQVTDKRRYLTEATTASNLGNRTGKAGEAPASAANVSSGKEMRLPASSTSRPPGPATSQGQGQGVAGNAPTMASLTSSSNSRIPRPTNSVQKTVGRLAAPNAAAGGSTLGGRSGESGILAATQLRTAKISSGDRLSGGMGASAGGLTKSYTMSSLASNFGIQAADEDASSLAGSEATLNGKSSSRRLSLTGAGASPTTHSASAPALSTSVQLILNAYTAAKTQSEIDGVLRRARVTTYASNLSGTDREVLSNLISHHDTSKQSGDRDKATQANPISKAKVSDLVTTPKAPRSAAAPSTGATAGGTPAAITPASRRSRTSMVTTSSGARVAREDALAASLRVGRTSDLGASSPNLNARSSSATSTLIEEDERQGDAEMEAYIRRSHAKKAAAGVSQKELEEMLRFPEPVPPSKAYSPRQAEALYSNLLSNYELEEMFDHKEIFFVGDAQTKIRAHRDRPTDNYGYDDERGDYQVIEGDHLAYRYEIMGTLGRGSFGQVLQCKDHKTGRSVAVKLIRNKKRFHHQALVEIKILQNLVDWDPEEKYNVIKMTDHFYFRNHLCISMELLSINLYELIKANSFAGFTTGLIRRFTSQVLAALSLMKQHKVVHCDLKPENILLMHPRKSGIKVIDFGSSCFEYEKVYTYIQSRFYRSPEVILGMNYHAAIDIWSLGCIMAELYTGFPLFPGENEQEQLACIMEVLGVPDRYLVERSTRKKLFFDSTGAPRPVVNSKGKRRRPGTKSLSQALKCNEDLFIDFLAKCLIWDPERRIKPDTAMRHPWIRSAAGQKVIVQSLSLTPGSHVRQLSLSQREHGLGGPQAPSTTGGIRSTRATLSGGDHGSSIPSSMPRSVTGNVAGIGSGGGSGAALVSTRRTPVHSSATSGASLVGAPASSAAALRRNQQPVS